MNYIVTNGQHVADFKRSMYEQQSQKYSTLDKHVTEPSRNKDVNNNNNNNNNNNRTE
jgi:hypothetical protein